MGQYLVLDYGGSAIKYSLMDQDANALVSGKLPAPRSGMEELLESARTLKAMFEGQYDGVAISLPGRIDTDKGYAHSGGAFPFIRGHELRREYEEIYGKPVVLANDGKCAAAAELYKGALQGIKCGGVILCGTGIAGGIIIDGKVWMGASGGAGELSLLIQNSDMFLGRTGQDKEPGQRFWDSTYMGTSSTTALIQMYAAARGIPYDPATQNGMEFFKDYDAGDEIARQVLKTFGENIAVGIRTVQSVIEGERFAIGGGISARPEVTQAVIEANDEMNRVGGAFIKPEIVQCQFGNDANQIGALMFYLQRHPEN